MLAAKYLPALLVSGATLTIIACSSDDGARSGRFLGNSGGSNQDGAVASLDSGGASGAGSGLNGVVTGGVPVSPGAGGIIGAGGVPSGGIPSAGGFSQTGGASPTGGAPPIGSGGASSGWRCDSSHYGTGDGCDCNCGIDDPDCNGAGTSSPTTQCPCSSGECGSNPGDPCTPTTSSCGCSRCWTNTQGACCYTPPAGTGGSPSTGPHRVSCDNAEAHIGYDPDWCSCVPLDSNTGATSISGQCRKDPDPWFTSKTMCCAESGYPRTGSCSCSLKSDPWACYDKSGGTSPECSCGYVNFGLSTTTACNNLPDPDGLPWVCCANSTRLTCDCYKNRTTCPTGTYSVGDCFSGSAMGFARPPSSCLSGHVALASCDGGTSPQCTDSSDCPGSCTGTDTVCCPSCNSGRCGVYCCGPSGCF